MLPRRRPLIPAAIRAPVRQDHFDLTNVLAVSSLFFLSAAGDWRHHARPVEEGVGVGHPQWPVVEEEPVPVHVRRELYEGELDVPALRFEGLDGGLDGCVGVIVVVGAVEKELGRTGAAARLAQQDGVGVLTGPRLAAVSDPPA